MRQHLGEARDSQLGKRHQRNHALSPHLLATDAADAQLRAGALAQGPDQRGPERVARRLAGDDKDERRGIASTHAGRYAAAARVESRRFAPYRVLFPGLCLRPDDRCASVLGRSLGRW
jgi:hypothetical protein